MRNIINLVLLSLAASSLASPIDTHNLDVAVKEVNTPKNMHAECDMRDPQCKAINDSGFHSVNEFEGHLGRQAEVMSNTESKVAADEDQDDLSDTLRNDGPVIQHDLQGRKHSELNKDLKAIKHESYPDGSVRFTGGSRKAGSSCGILKVHTISVEKHIGNLERCPLGVTITVKRR